MSTVYLNVEFIPKEEAFVSVDDRGFLFGDGIYEVTSAYRGNLFYWDRHLARANRGLDALRIDFDPATLQEAHHRLIRENGFENADKTWPISLQYDKL